MKKSAAALLAADPLFMGMNAAWPLAGEQPAPQVCELAILDKNGAILFDAIIKPTTRGVLQTGLIPAEHIMTAPTIDTLWDNLVGITNRRDVVMFNPRLSRALLKASAAPYGLPDLPGRAHSVQARYLDHYGTAFTATTAPSLSHIALHCELESMTLAISLEVDQPWRIHHAVNEAEICRHVLMHLVACAQANDEGQQGDLHES
jgi:hypothetical protein